MTVKGDQENPALSSRKWALKSTVYLLSVADDFVVLGWLGQRILIKSRLAREIPAVLDLLSSPKSLASLRPELKNPWTESAIEDLLAVLGEKKLLLQDDGDDADELDKSADAPYWAPYREVFSVSNKSWGAVRAAMASAKFLIASRMNIPENFLGDLDARRIPSVDRAFDSRPEPGAYVLLLASAFDFPLLERLSRPALETKARVLPVLLDTFGAIVGPVIGAPGSPCLKCLSQRLQAGVSRSEMLSTAPDRHFDSVAAAWPVTSWRKLDAILLDELFKLAGDAVHSPLTEGAYRFDFLNNRSEYENVFPVPGCICATLFRDEMVSGHSGPV